MRAFLVGLLVVVFGALVVVLNLGVWAGRVILDEDTFVRTVNQSLEDEAVQQALAERAADRVLVQLDVPTVTFDVLNAVRPGPGAAEPGPVAVALALPIERAVHNVLVDAALAVFQSPRVDAAFEAMLRLAHRSMIAAIENDSLLTITPDAVVLDLRAFVAEVVNQIAGPRAVTLIQRIEVDEDAGRIVIVEDSPLAFVWWFAGVYDDILWLLLAITIIVAVAAVLIARDKPGAVIWLGGVAIAVTLILIVLSPIARHLATDWVAEEINRAAAEAVYEELTQPLRSQSILVLLGGAVLVAAGLIARRRSRAAREHVGATGERPDAASARGRLLRLGAFGLAGAALLVAPDSLLSVGVVLGLCLALIELATSSAPWAVGARTRIAAVTRSEGPRPIGDEPDTVLGLLAQHAGWLHWAGLGVFVVALVLLPNREVETIAALGALLLLYLGAIELIQNAVDGQVVELPEQPSVE